MGGDRPLEQKGLFDEFRQSGESQPAQQEQEALSASIEASLPRVIRLYPRSWLYNAAVVGFLQVLKENESDLRKILGRKETWCVESMLQLGGEVEVPASLFEKIGGKRLPKVLEYLAKKTVEDDDLESWLLWEGKEEKEKGKIEIPIEDWMSAEEAYCKGNKELLRDLLAEKGVELPQEFELLFQDSDVGGSKKREKILILAGEHTWEITVQKTKVKGEAKIRNQIRHQVFASADYFSSDGQPTRLGYRFIRFCGKMFGKNQRFQNLVQLTSKEMREFIEVVARLSQRASEEHQGVLCGFCGSRYVSLKCRSKLEKRWGTLQSTHLKNFELGGSDKFPNGFWAYQQSMPICSLCAFLLLHHHFAFCKLGRGEEIFIQAPSFGLMYRLNQFVQQVYESQESREVRHILAMSLVEFARKMQVTLGRWTKANIEVVVVRRRRDKKTRKEETIVDFYSLPQPIVDLLSHREIASLLHEIGELQVLELVLEGKFHQILEYAHRLLRIGGKAKSEQNKADRDFLTSFLKREKNRRSPLETAQRMLELYGFLEEQRRRI